MNEYWIWAAFWAVFGGSVGMYIGIWITERRHAKERNERQEIKEMAKNARKQ